jgi:hypothetical protein
MMTLIRIAMLGGPFVRLDGAARLVVDRRELGRGYGRVTPAGNAALARASESREAWPRLDGVYSAKAAAALLRLHAKHEGPLLFWSTKAENPLPPPRLDALRTAPRALVDWMR